MFCDHRDTTGFCIVQECRGADNKPMSKYWVMYEEEDEQNGLMYPYATLNTYQKALKRLETLENESQ